MGGHIGDKVRRIGKKGGSSSLRMGEEGEKRGGLGSRLSDLSGANSRNAFLLSPLCWSLSGYPARCSYPQKEARAENAVRLQWEGTVGVVHSTRLREPRAVTVTWRPGQ